MMNVDPKEVLWKLVGAEGRFTENTKTQYVGAHADISTPTVVSETYKGTLILCSTTQNKRIEDQSKQHHS